MSEGFRNPDAESHGGGRDRMDVSDMVAGNAVSGNHRIEPKSSARCLGHGVEEAALSLGRTPGRCPQARVSVFAFIASNAPRNLEPSIYHLRVRTQHCDT